MQKRTPKNSSKKAKVATKHPREKFQAKRHILPPLLGISIFFLVLGLFNAQYLVALASYRLTEPVVTTTELPPLNPDDTSAPAVSDDARQIIIDSIGVNAPIVFDEKNTDEESVQHALERGVLHYGATALPGTPGNVVIAGHSSNYPWAPGDYKFVFMLLEKVNIKDAIIIDYRGKRFAYKVNKIEVVAPENVSPLAESTTNELTLITCTPVGTNLKRLIIKARQVAPIPELIANPADTDTVKNIANISKPLPSDSPSFWENIVSIFK